MIVPSRLVSLIAAAVGRPIWLAIALLAGSAGLGCLPQPAFAAAGRISIQSGGVTRTATMVQHRRLKQARRALIIVLRSGKGKGSHRRRVFGLGEMAHSSGPVLIYPDPFAGHWSDAPGPAAARDAAFIRDLIAKLVSDGIADRRRVFIVGIGSGGLTALRIACDDTPLFAGAAALLASLPADLAKTCQPSRPLPLIMIVGTADSLVPYKGGRANLPDSRVDLLSVNATLAVFGKAAGCAPGRTTTLLPDRDTHDGTRAFLDRLNGCKVPVEAIRAEGGGHTIPGHWAGAASESPRGLHNNDVESARLIWDFFRRLGA